MRRRNIGRTLSTLLLVAISGFAAASCGSSPDNLFDGGVNPGGYDASYASPDATMLMLGGGDGSTATTCVPKTCAQLGFNCGPQGDGCGGQIQCGTCTLPAFCGGGGPSVCGLGTNIGIDGGVIGGDGGSACTPETCASLGYDCGFTGDGCGSSIQCGATCPALEYCGGGGPNVCGGTTTVAPDGGSVSPCVPQTCTSLGYNCGLAGDGCGNQLDCSVGNAACVSPQYCGGAGPGQCGGNNGHNADGGTVSICVPTTCAALGFNCGPAGDGCGGTLDCNAGNPACTLPQFCGGAGPSKCGGNVNVAPDGGQVCVPQTCGANECGQKADGCGNLITCPVTCTAPDVCGGSGVAFQCGHCPPGELCQKQVTCTAPATTTLTGVVKAGVSTWLTVTEHVTATPDPVPNVLVYIPNDPLPLAKMGQGYAANACPQCAADVSGNPLVSTYTAFDGTFTLTNVPVGQNIPVVIQMGRWRRVFSVNVTTSCGANSAGTLNLPQNQSQGDIPLTAISTGAVDQLECVLLKMGIDEAEFTSNTAAPLGRIHLYGQAIAGGTTGVPGSTVTGSANEAALMGAGGTLPNYDQLMLPCWGAAVTKPAADLTSLSSYADSGGHFFATHFSYTWLNTNGEFVNAASWDVGADSNAGGNGNGVNFTGNVSTAVPPDPPAPNAGVFEKWLALVGALSSTAPPQVTLTAARHDVDSPAINSSVDWIDGTDPAPKRGSSANMLLHFTFNTPVPSPDAGAPAQCGHAIFSDFHVTGQAGSTRSNGTIFPAECTAAPLTSQERILEYMIWDLGACVGPPPPPVCNKLSCADQNITCGPAGDGCGGTIASCGTCGAPLTCGGGGVNGQCGSSCVPQMCPANIQCGPWGDGCGGLITSCGTCPAGQTCGGGGVDGQCGAPDGGACAPQACPANIQCGPWGNGCGGVVQCGTCPPGETCGGAGVNGQCGAVDSGACVPQGCPANVMCGPSGDGCGNLIQSCGTCPAGQTCGGGGVNGQCGGGCVPLTCAGLGISCGPAGDGCGGSLACGTCPTGQTCGGGGAPGVCGAPITPK